MATLCSIFLSQTSGAASFVNWENPHIHPMDMTPDATRLLVVNTADNRLEVFDIGGGVPVSVGSVPVGLDPVSVRARSNDEAWVVNHISDSISIVDLSTLNVRATLATRDEPADVVFAGSPQQAFVSCSQANVVQVFDPSDTSVPPIDIAIDAEDPRAMAVSPGGTEVYVAIFESGNGSTVLAGEAGQIVPNAVSHPDGPYGGTNPPPNDGGGFSPGIDPAFLPGGSASAPQVALIVRKDPAGRWRDDNSGDWTEFVSGSSAANSGRTSGWDLPDRDVAIIDVNTFSVTYATRLMNAVMALAVNPSSGEITAVGTDATNDIRYEPNLKGRFLRVNMAIVNPSSPGSGQIFDLNGGHLDYSDAQVAAQSDSGSRDPALTEMSIGDPRGIVWNGAGTRGYVSGMGSNNVIAVDASGARQGSTIEVGQGPTGLIWNESNDRLYVLNRFGGGLSVVDTETNQELSRVAYFDPTPPAIRAGRPFLYDTHLTSGLGHVSCASCHLDARMDRLAWDLGDPLGTIKSVDPSQHNLMMDLELPSTFPDFHPMKGPMTTQTLQDIIGKEPHHWRGDRDGIEKFNGAFQGLLGDESQLTAGEMQAFEDFLATIRFPPNPFRRFDNSLPDDLPLPGHFASGEFGPAGTPLPNGDATRGLALFQPPTLLDTNVNMACVTCHSFPTGAGADVRDQGGTFVPIPIGPGGEHHLALVGFAPLIQITVKVPHLRNLYDKVGFETTQTDNRAGFGFAHDGVDTLSRFLSVPSFGTNDDQDVADLIALLLSFSGGGFPAGSTDVADKHPPGVPSLDTHAGVGVQITVDDQNKNSPLVTSRLSEMQALAEGGVVGMVAKGIRDGIPRGYQYTGGGQMQSDRASETIPVDALRQGADAGAEITFTVVVAGTESRIGIDRDEDGFFDRDEIDAGSDPAEPDDPPTVALTSPSDGSTVAGAVKATADASDDIGVAQVEFFVDGASIGVDTNGADGWSISWDTTTASEGLHAVSATATDILGQTSGDAVVVTVDNVADAMIFEDGFESGDTGAWSSALGGLRPAERGPRTAVLIGAQSPPQ